MIQLEEVHIVTTNRGTICSVYADKAEAEAAIKRYNENPWLFGGQPDPDAPYHVESWVIYR